MNRVFKVLIAILAISVVLITGIPMLRSDALALDETSPTTVYAGPGSNVVLNRNPDPNTTLGLLILLLGATLLFLAKCMIETRNSKEAASGQDPAK